jgi:hypothetical protein
LEYFDDGDKIFLKYPHATIQVGMTWEIFFCMYMDESHKMDEKFG